MMCREERCFYKNKNKKQKMKNEKALPAFFSCKITKCDLYLSCFHISSG